MPELRQLMDRASPKATLKKACTVQLLSDDPVLPYRPEGTIELQLEASEAAEAWPLVPELLQAGRRTPPEGEDQPSCMVLLCCFTAPPWRNFDARRRFAAGLRGIDDHFGALCALQSAFLGHAQSGRELLAQLLTERAASKAKPAVHQRALHLREEEARLGTSLAMLVLFRAKRCGSHGGQRCGQRAKMRRVMRRWMHGRSSENVFEDGVVTVSQSMGAMCKKEESQEIEAMRRPGGVKTEPTESKAGEDGTNIKRQPKVKVEKGQSDEKAAVVKADQMTAWARQCVEFRRKSTWMPSRPVLLTKKPCCPASLFFSSSIVPEEKDPPCVQRLSQKELCCLRRFFERAAAAATQEDARFPASGAACMKMWPWMRDLPSSIWAGRGLAYDEQCGLRRLSCAGGAEAMHGVQVWESVGAGQPTAQPPTAAQSAAAPRSVAVGDARANVPGNAVKPAKVLAKQQEKQSGVPGISWQISRFCWQLRWTEKDKKGGSARHIQNFTISSFMKQGLNEVEAEAAALEAAKAFRADLVARGRIKEKLRDESLTSDVPGVKFAKARKKWHVSIPKPGGGRIQGGYFTEKAAAEARATELRELHGLQRTVKRCAARAELPVFQPKVAFPGVTWHVQKQCWQARTSGSKSRKYCCCSFRPLDHSEPELEKAFARAVAWLKKQRKEIQAGEGAAAKGKIDKKGRSKKS
ncbi:unnamed protein product [Effrenium voratum]|nr:unnamed protein product [Effrenium voratum]